MSRVLKLWGCALDVARGTIVDATRPLRLQNLEGDFAVLFGGGGGEEGAKRLRGSTLLADHLAEIVLAHFEAKDGLRRVADFVHLDGGGIIHQRAGDDFDESFHLLRPWGRRLWRA